MSIDGESLIELVDSDNWSERKTPKADQEVEITLKRGADITYTQGLTDLVRFSIPSILTMVSRRMIDIISYIFIGRLADSDFIAGAGLGIVTSNVLCYAVTLGLAGGIDTLSSQAFGSKNNYMAGCYLNRAQVIVSVIFIPQALILFFTATPLMWIGQPEVSSMYAQDYTRWFLPGIIALTHIELISRFLASQGVFYLVLKVQVAAMFYHLAVCYILTHILDLQLIGIALANSITHVSTLIFLVCYITFSKDVVRKDSWHFINSDSFKGIIEYLRYGLPSMFMTVLEFWCFEMLIVMSGYLGTDEQGASIIIINFLTLVYMVPFGMSFATTNLVGSNIGAGKPETAKRYAKVSISCTCILAICTIAFMMTLKHQIARIFTDHDNVANLISSVFPIVSLFVFSDYVQGTAGGTIRAMGYQKYATFFCLFNYWCIAMPLTYLFTFYFDFKLWGIWMGMPIGLSLIAISFLAIIFIVDWQELASKVVDRIQKEKRSLL